MTDQKDSKDVARQEKPQVKPLTPQQILQGVIAEHKKTVARVKFANGKVARTD